MNDIIDMYLCEIGLKFPEDKAELDLSERLNKGYSYLISEEKINPHKILHEIKTQAKKGVKNSFFKRAVLSAEIVNQCHKENTFGIVKFQKLAYLCEQTSKMDLNTNYLKHAAGPHDNKFTYHIKNEFKKQKWFSIKKGKNSRKTIFEPLENSSKYRQYYNTYYNKSHVKIQYIINKFKKATTNQVELVATIYACWLEVIAHKVEFSNEVIIKKVYEWSLEKNKFSEKQIISAVLWMVDNGITPLNK